MKAKKTSPALGVWSTTATLVYSVTGPDKVLHCFVGLQPTGTWAGLALERSTDAKTSQEVLDDHAHQAIGHYAQVGDAIAAIESFAAAWHKGRLSPAGKCPCPDITTKTRSRK